jgi:hypothetical protein
MTGGNGLAFLSPAIPIPGNGGVCKPENRFLLFSVIGDAKCYGSTDTTSLVQVVRGSFASV